MSRNLIFKFIFIVSRNPSEKFDATIFSDNEESARFKLSTIVQGDFKCKIRCVEEV